MAKQVFNYYKIKLTILIVLLQVFSVVGGYSNQANDVLINKCIKTFINAYNEKLVSKQKQKDLIEVCIKSIDSIESRKNKLLERMNAFSGGAEIRLSIVIDCFGQTSYLSDLLDSIFSQNVDFNYDVICIGDVDSLTFSPSLSYYSKTHKNLFFFPSANDIEYNNLFINCRSELILYLSQKDIMPPLVLQRMVNMFVNVRSDVIIFNNIIALYKGAFNSVPSHDKFYTTFEMGRASYNLLDILQDKHGVFTWGIKYGPRLITKTSLIECGGFFGSREKYAYNLGIQMLFKGYESHILSNGFCYQYYEDGNWFSDIFNTDCSEQIKMICEDFPEFLDREKINKFNFLNKYISFSGLPWISIDLIKKIILAYQLERSGKYKEAYQEYIEVILSKNDCHIKIYLKCMRAFLLADGLDEVNNGIRVIMLNMQKYLENSI